MVCMSVLDILARLDVQTKTSYHIGQKETDPRHKATKEFGFRDGSSSLVAVFKS